PYYILILIALIPSMIGHFRMGVAEFLLLIFGGGLLGFGLYPYLVREKSGKLTPARQGKIINFAPEPPESVRPQHSLGRWGLAEDVKRFGWMYLLGLPYFITWFYSYSYHYRLSFAVVPLMLMPTAVILARWLAAERLRGALRQVAFAAA